MSNEVCHNNKAVMDLQYGQLDVKQPRNFCCLLVYVLFNPTPRIDRGKYCKYPLI